MEKSIYLDIDLCVGCGACAVACMDQNDIDPDNGQTALRRIYQVEEGQYPDASHPIPLGRLYALRRRALRDGMPDWRHRQGQRERSGWRQPGALHWLS